MPTFGFAPSKGLLNQTPKPDSNIVAIDVGGQIFQTTKQTLNSAGPTSLFCSILESSSSSSQAGVLVPFIDRDPELFSVFLSLLRNGTLPSKAKAYDIQDLIFESRYYGVETLLINSLSNPSQFEPFNLERSFSLPLNGRDSPSAIATTRFGSVHVAHGSKITSFDWSLRRKSTILTQFSAVDSLLAISPSVVAAGATDFSGLQIIDLEEGLVKETFNWENATKSSSTVQAIGSSPEFLFASFESGRRNSNSIVVYDIQNLLPVTEIGRCEIYGAELESAIPATKLRWISTHNLLMASGSHSGPSGVSGNLKLWDVRSGSYVYDLKETVDCFSDVSVSDSLSVIFKVGVNSGEAFFLDLRTLGADNPWVCLDDGRKMMNGNTKKEGSGCKTECHGNQVFCTRGGNVEMWSEVVVGFKKKSEEGSNNKKVMRKNLLGRAEDMGGARISSLAFGGNKMFLTRKDQQFVEIWHSNSARDMHAF